MLLSPDRTFFSAFACIIFISQNLGSPFSKIMSLRCNVTDRFSKLFLAVFFSTLKLESTQTDKSDLILIGQKWACISYHISRYWFGISAQLLISNKVYLFQYFWPLLQFAAVLPYFSSRYRSFLITISIDKNRPYFSRSEIGVYFYYYNCNRTVMDYILLSLFCKCPQPFLSWRVFLSDNTFDFCKISYLRTPAFHFLIIKLCYGAIRLKSPFKKVFHL